MGIVGETGSDDFLDQAVDGECVVFFGGDEGVGVEAGQGFGHIEWDLTGRPTFLLSGFLYQIKGFLQKVFLSFKEEFGDRIGGEEGTDIQ